VDEEFFFAKFCRVIDLENIKRGVDVMTQCPECEAEVSVEGLLVGEIIFCPDCNAELEVINVEQPEVALAPQVEEDWGE
jgi:alpha-aminoadipate carrier protein LysW